MADIDITGLLQDALTKLNGFGPNGTGDELDAIVAELQPATAAISAIQDEATLQQIQALLLKLFAQRGQLAGSYPALARRWSALEDLLVASGAAALAQLLALPKPSPATCDDTKALLECLVQAIDMDCTVEQLSDLEDQVSLLRQQMASLSADQAALQALQDSFTKLQQRLDHLTKSVENPLPLFLTALQAYLANPADNGSALLYQLYILGQTEVGFQQIRKAISAECNLQTLLRLIEFTDLVGSGDWQANIRPPSAQWIQLLNDLRDFARPFITVTGQLNNQWGGDLTTYPPLGASSYQTFTGDPMVGSGLMVFDHNLNPVVWEGQIESAKVTFSQSSTQQNPQNPGMTLVRPVIVLNVQAAEDYTWKKRAFIFELAWWKHEAFNPSDTSWTQPTLQASCDGVPIVTNEGNVHLISHNMISFNSLCLRCNEDPDSFLSNPEIVVMTIRDALRAQAAAGGH